MKFVIFGIMAIVVIVGGALLIAQQGGLRNGDGSAPTTPQATESPTISPDQTRVPEDWEIFTSETHNFSIQHPPDVTVEQRPFEGVRLIKYGPTQEEGTEVYDAISLSFNSGSLEGKSLQAFVQNQHQAAQNEPITENVGPVQPVTIAGRSGFQFTVTGLGEFTRIYLPWGDNQYLMIIDGTVDPTNQGFEETVDQMLSTLEMIE